MRRGSALLLALAALAALPAGAAAQGSAEAVVLMSGFDSSTPFSTPAAACAGQEGAFSTAIAPALRAAGIAVFTAPAVPAGKALPAPCVGAGQTLPPASATVDTSGDVDANGAALAGLLAFLRDSYGVRAVHLIGHSDGGLWSRSAITQHAAYAGVVVRSLSTVGTPHTGAFPLDFAEQVGASVCDGPARPTCLGEQKLLDTVMTAAGPTAFGELSGTFLATWNPRQAIGGCPVTTLAGAHVALPGTLPGYYDPSDGLVGQASALAQASRSLIGAPIVAPRFPNHVDGGAYDLVHDAGEGFLSPSNELNSPQVAQRFVQAVQAAGPGGPDCGSAAAPPAARPVTLTLALTRLDASAGAGPLPAPTAGSVLVAPNAAVLRCGALSQGGPAAPGVPGIQLTPLLPCTAPATVSAGPSVLLSADPRRRVRLTVSGPRIRVAVTGPRVRSLRVQAKLGPTWRAVPLRRGAGALPATGTSTTLRVVVVPSAGGRAETAAATVAR